MTQESRETVFLFGTLGIVLAWMAFVVGVSFFMRRKSGRPVFVEPPKDALFVERWTSGRSMSNLMTRMGGARNCLCVAVAKDRLMIHPHFPFSLMFLPEIYQLDCDIPLASIQDVSEGKVLFVKAVTISFTGKDGATSQLQLFMRKASEFQNVLAAARQAR
jgi:hypothetical protein